MSDFIERARALDKEATEGPWMLDGPDHMWWGEEDHEHESAYVVTAGPDRTAVAVAHRPASAKPEGSYRSSARRFDADSKFIAAARTMLPAAAEALARVRALHAPEEYDDPTGEFFCRTCGDWNLRADPLGMEPIWPCPTVQAIDQALEQENA